MLWILKRLIRLRNNERKRGKILRKEVNCDLEIEHDVFSATFQ